MAHKKPQIQPRDSGALPAGTNCTMRWHVELNEGGKSLRVEHVDDPGVAMSTAREFAAQAGGGHARASSDQIERAFGMLADQGLDEVLPGVDRHYDINDNVSVVVAGLDDGDADEDCWKCRSAA